MYHVREDGDTYRVCIHVVKPNSLFPHVFQNGQARVLEKTLISPHKLLNNF